MQFIDLKTHQEKIDDFRFVIASAAWQSPAREIPRALEADPAGIHMHSKHCKSWSL